MDSMEEVRQREAEEQAAVFRALADPTRLKLVKLLRRQRFPDSLTEPATVSMKTEEGIRIMGIQVAPR